MRRDSGVRNLYIEKFPKGVDPAGFLVLTDRESIFRLTERWTGSEKLLQLDCRQIKNEGMYQLLLKFIEDYAGGIEMVVQEPVPVTILSRFSVIQKGYTPAISGSIWHKLLVRVPSHLKERVGALLGLENNDN